MAESYNPRLKALIIGVVDNQLAENAPPITRETLARLISIGYSEARAKEMIGAVVSEFIYDAMKDNIAFDEKKYARRLESLK